MNIAIEQIQHGNEQAFKSLFDEYYQGLCVFASAYLKDNDLSADVVQEAFVKFWNRRRDFDHIVKIKSFLYTIVRNDCLNIVQRQKVVLEDVSVFENSGFFHDKLIETESWKSHATLTLLATQDLPTFGYNMIDPLKSWCWGSILFYPFKISRFS